MESAQGLVSNREPNGGTKKTRFRTITSCSECNRRKQRCNREWPCNQCLSRRVVDMCHYNIARPKTRLATNTSQPDTSQGNALYLQTDSITDEPPSIRRPVENGDENETSLEEISVSHTVLGPIFYPAIEPNDPSVLIQINPTRDAHFLGEVNWLYEELYTPKFLERYNTWWSLLDYDSDDNIQFGVLLLRLCFNSLQFLPHPNYPIDFVFKDRIDILESRYNSNALTLDAYQPRKPSLLRIHQLLIYISTLSTAGNAEGTYEVLREAVKEAQSINLFLEEKWIGITEFDKEVRRKTFWNLYVWDRWLSTFFGRWPLIPDLYFTVRLPSETPYFATPRIPGSPTIFTDVLLNIRICQYMHSSFSAPAKKAERLDPIAVASHFKTFQEIFIDKLPPAFRLHDPDTSWDEAIPSLEKKREFVHIGTLSVVESMHKGFVGSMSSKEGENAELIMHHRTTLLNACIGILEALGRLHVLMGGGSHRYFFLSLSCIEATTVLGLCLLSNSAASNWNTGFGHELRQRSLDSFHNGLSLLQLLSQRSAPAQKGIVVLRKLKARIEKMSSEHERQKGSSPRSKKSTKQGTIVEDLSGNDTVHGTSIRYPQDQDAAVIKEWEAFSTSNDFSWCFEGNVFMNPEDFGMNFGDVNPPPLIHPSLFAICPQPHP